jgi:hypothetical protein
METQELVGPGGIVKSVGKGGDEEAGKEEVSQWLKGTVHSQASRGKEVS